MKVVVSCHGKFHHFDLARELHARGILERLFTGYPRWKLRQEKLPLERVNTFPWFMTPFMVSARWGLDGILYKDGLERTAARTFDRHVRGHLPECDVVIAISGRGLETGQAVQGRGGYYVCDRGSSHIQFQDQILREEYARWGLEFPGIDTWIIDRENREYEQADAITVPSEFARRSFLEKGIPECKLHKVPYGVQLDRFSKTGEPDRGRFDVLFAGGVSLRKGVPDLLEAFKRLRHPNKWLTFVGSVSRDLSPVLKRGFLLERVEFVGRWPQDRLRCIMSRSHVLVLPSVEGGFGLVLAQAMACWLPVIASEHTGARDLFTDGVEGCIVPIRSPEQIADRLQELADRPDLRETMSHASLNRVRSLGGWHAYGERMTRVFAKLSDSKEPAES